MNSTWRRSGIIYIIILLAGVALATFLFSNTEKTPELELSDVVAKSQEHTIQSITEDGQWLTIIDNTGAESRSFKGETSLFEITGLDLTGVKYKVQPGGFDWAASCLVACCPSWFLALFCFSSSPVSVVLITRL